MKKILSVIISITAVFIFAFSVNVFAEDMGEGTGGNEIYGSSEAGELLPDMDLILSGVDSFGVSMSDLDINRVVRVYPTVIIFEGEVESPDEMRNLLSDRKYVYVIPIDTIETWYSVTVAKGEEIRDYSRLDEEGIKRLEERVGRWHYSEIIQYDGKPDKFQDYKKKVNTFLDFYGIEESETFFIGGTTTNSVTIAVCFPKDGSQGAYYIAMDEFPLNPQSIEDIQGAVYSYDEMKEYAKKLVPRETETEIESTGEYESTGGYEYESTGGYEDESMYLDELATAYFGGTGRASSGRTTAPWLYVIIAVVVCAAVVVTVIAIRKHHPKA